MENLLNLKSCSIEEIMSLLQEAEKCRQGNYMDSLKGKIVANLFFEPSTRTQYSFNTAEEKLGCKVININASSSSMQKGESFYDTVKTFSSFQVDAIVIRSSENEYYKQLLGKIKTPILNAGDGTKDHPTQSLLDLLTIYQEFHHFEGLKIAVVGDIKHSRVAHSNIEIMERLGMDVYCSGPQEFKDEEYRYIEFEKAVEEMDIIMLLRVQHERHEQAMKISKEEYHQQYGLTMERVNKMKKNAIIMHPAPFNRNVEIADDVVECEKSRIFKQIENGVFVRMAALRRSMRG